MRSAAHKVDIGRLTGAIQPTFSKSCWRRSSTIVHPHWCVSEEGFKTLGAGTFELTAWSHNGTGRMRDLGDGGGPVRLDAGAIANNPRGRPVVVCYREQDRRCRVSLARRSDGECGYT
jgi:hypothetical protein